MTHLDILYAYQILLIERMISVVESFYVLHATNKQKVNCLRLTMEQCITISSLAQIEAIIWQQNECTNLATGH